jgi:hypothetical protein
MKITHAEVLGSYTDIQCPTCSVAVGVKCKGVGTDVVHATRWNLANTLVHLHPELSGVVRYFLNQPEDVLPMQATAKVVAATNQDLASRALARMVEVQQRKIAELYSSLMQAEDDSSPRLRAV